MRILLFLLLGASLIASTELFISHQGHNVSDCGNFTFPCLTLEYAYQLSSEGDALYLIPSEHSYAPLVSNIDHSLTIGGYFGKASVRCPPIKYGCTFFVDTINFLTLENLILQECLTPSVTAVCMPGTLVGQLILNHFDYLNNPTSGGILYYEPSSRLDQNVNILFSHVTVKNNTVFVNEDGACFLMDISVLDPSLNGTGIMIWEDVILIENTGAVVIEIQKERVDFNIIRGTFKGVESFASHVVHRHGGSISINAHIWENMPAVALSCYCRMTPKS